MEKSTETLFVVVEKKPESNAVIEAVGDYHTCHVFMFGMIKHYYPEWDWYGSYGWGAEEDWFVGDGFYEDIYDDPTVRHLISDPTFVLPDGVTTYRMYRLEPACLEDSIGI